VKLHAEESRGQADRLRECLQSLGTDVSSLKTGLAWLGGNLQALFGSATGAAAGDEVVKGVIVSYAFEHFEIACYRTLIAAAAQTGLDEVETTCSVNLREEEAMQEWLADHIPSITTTYLARETVRPEAAQRRAPVRQTADRFSLASRLRQPG
jgi:ferritin-like metal-binding protein YciE